MLLLLLLRRWRWTGWRPYYYYYHYFYDWTYYYVGGAGARVGVGCDAATAGSRTDKHPAVTSVKICSRTAHEPLLASMDRVLLQGQPRMQFREYCIDALRLEEPQNQSRPKRSRDGVSDSKNQVSRILGFPGLGHRPGRPGGFGGWGGFGLPRFRGSLWLFGGPDHPCALKTHCLKVRLIFAPYLNMHLIFGRCVKHLSNI